MNVESGVLLFPRPGALSNDADWRLTSVCLTCVAYIRSVGGRRVRPARLSPARPAWLKAAAARFRCRPGRGHIMAAARLQLALHVLGNAYPFLALFAGEG